MALVRELTTEEVLEYAKTRVDPAALAEILLLLSGRRTGTRRESTNYVVRVGDVRVGLIGANDDRSRFLAISMATAGSGGIIYLGDDRVDTGAHRGIPLAAIPTGGTIGGSWEDNAIVPFKGEWYAVNSLAGPHDMIVREEY